MSAMQRNKGKTGEREAADLVRQFTGWDVRRRVRQHDGDSDLEGVPGWTVEVKRHRTALAGEVAQWWSQAVAQAARAGPQHMPVLLYRADRADWRAVWPLWVVLALQELDQWAGIEWTANTTVQAWAAVVKRSAAIRTSVAGHGASTHTSTHQTDGCEVRFAWPTNQLKSNSEEACHPEPVKTEQT